MEMTVHYAKNADADVDASCRKKSREQHGFWLLSNVF